MNRTCLFVIAFYHTLIALFRYYTAYSPIAENKISEIRNPICRGLSERVTELFEYGINNIWVRGSGEQCYHITIDLGISMDEWAEAIPLSGLFGTDGRMKKTSWNRLLQLDIETGVRPTTVLNGKRNTSLWFQFEGPLGKILDSMNR